MSDLLPRLYNGLASWAASATERGWLSPSDIEPLRALTTATASDLFNQQQRPLVIGLFGGTGVGKSTLLNRFASDAIAHVSAERPTSRRVTLYVHASVTVDRLPKEFPVDEVQTAIHHNKEYASVMWIDMPDFDSVETHNRDLVEHWLPHIDVLLYVVSPERYRDDAGWRMLMQHGNRHAWIFVMNHWDRGVAEQRTDFIDQLNRAGLPDPALYCTDSREPGADNVHTNAPDGFDELRRHIIDLADTQLVEQLEARGVIQRVRDIQHSANRLQLCTGQRDAIAATRDSWHAQWAQYVDAMQDSMDATMQELGEAYAEQPGGSLLRRTMNLLKSDSTSTPSADPPSGVNPETLPDSRSQSLLSGAFKDYFKQCVASTVHTGIAAGVPQQPLQAMLEKTASALEPTLNSQIETAVRESILLPGSGLTRGLYRVLGWASWVLPLAAMSWIAYRVVTVFWDGGEQAEYLGGNFATHSGMLLGLAWLIPTWLHVKCRPSRMQAARRGMQRGYANALVEITTGVNQGFDHLEQEHAELGEALQLIFKGAATQTDNALPASVRQLLFDPDQSSMTVRATVQTATDAAPVS